MADEKTQIEKTSEIIEKSAMRIDRDGREYRLIVSAFMSPRSESEVDLQKDWTNEDEIEDGLHEFVIGLQKQHKTNPGETGISYRHANMVSSEDAAIVEVWRLRKDEVWGDRTLVCGTGMLAMRIYGEKICKEIDSGEITGISVEGWARHVETASK